VLLLELVENLWSSAVCRSLTPVRGGKAQKTAWDIELLTTRGCACHAGCGVLYFLSSPYRTFSSTT
jgi:hypothetical protein